MDHMDEATEYNSEMAEVKGTFKLKFCEVCGAEAKYTCPKCEVKTCSLTCVDIHKKELECNGIRNKVKYVPLNEFTDLDLLNDYRFLEEVNRLLNKKKTYADMKIRDKLVPVHLYKLKKGAAQRKVLLLFMPYMFTRHRENTTYLNWKTNELFWRLEWIFPQAENIKCITEKALDTTRLVTILEQILNPISSEDTDIEELDLKLKLAEKLQFYRAAGLSVIKVLLKAEKVKNAKLKFYELDLELTLRENLEDKIIVEFPTLHVIMKDHVNMYEIIDSDEEICDTECKDFKANIETKRKENIRNNKKETKSINYFFNDLSESDDEKPTIKKETPSSSELNIPSYDELVKM
ncbi:box C/D snoRNA protein 1 [Pseudomyrmex gracilis]|uniref:box C/D snoRNA protein 1 n=1 Tax=Pseudomyrmex gracilis TaxID=219809 RepID=UPI000994AE3E|nr:box C/D snoRNA protein 1 [Pseudomyrmex gracilis]